MRQKYKYLFIGLMILLRINLMKAQETPIRFDRNELLKSVLEMGIDPSESKIPNLKSAGDKDSISNLYFSKLLHPENIAILAWDNIKPLKSVINIPFKDFGFMDSFNSYFQFADSYPTQFYFKDKTTDKFFGGIFPISSMRLFINLQDEDYNRLKNILFFSKDVLIIANISQILCVKDVYQGEWYLEGEKLFINIGGKKVPAREYFEKKGDIKKVQWNKFMIRER